MDTEHEDAQSTDVDLERKPVDPDDGDGVGFVGGSGGPASIIYGEDDEAEEHGDRLARGPEESR